MSDASPPQPVDEPATPDLAPATEDVPYGVETALGGMTREHLRNASPVVTEIRKTLEFHDSGTAVQCLRDVLGTIERAATEASRRRPKNRPPEFAELAPGALRQLAALCRVYALVDWIDLTPFVPQGALDVPAPESLPNGTLTVTIGEVDVTEHLVDPEGEIARAKASIAEHERQVIAERDAVKVLAETLGAEPINSDPFVNPEQFEWPPVELDPFTVPAPIVPAELDRLAGGEPPF